MTPKRPEFEIRRELELHATPEAVWDAVTTASAAWLFPTGEYEPRVGGAAPFGGTVTAWDPPRHAGSRMEGEDGWYNQVEHRIEPRGEGRVLLRYVHSGILVDDWETQYDGAGKHTDFYLHSLGQYLGHFQGRPVTYVAADGTDVPAAGEPDAFDVLGRTLGLAGDDPAGTPVHLELPGLAPIDGVVDYRTPHFIGIRSDDALYRFYGRNHFGGVVGLAHHLFAPEVAQAATEQAWAGWLAGTYAASRT